ncbi:hypothetical protein ACP179_00040 (plasmid) [Xenorhabdus stockiae]|uniref:hypothetical protein n=1 Tax=Xenorhabdus stockiae TaxID=351614 RepID=UPI003CF59ADA
MAQYADTITKQERLLVRIRKSESLIKRLRPEIKHAIDAGYLDVEPDILEHGAEYYVAKDKRVFRTGRVYYCRMPYRQYSDSTALFLVRVKAINIDTGRASVDQLWCDNHVARLNNAVSVSVTSLEAEADFSESELELKTWLFGKVYLKEVVSRLNKQQFFAYLKSGDLILKDNEVVYREGGGFATYSLYSSSRTGVSEHLNYGADNWLKENADNIVYPDSNDDVLKTSVAEQYRKSAYILPMSFMIAMFGADYKTAITSYGETASPSLITELVAKYISDKLSHYGSERENESGSGSEQIRFFLKIGHYDARGFIDSALGYRMYSGPNQYREYRGF